MTEAKNIIIKYAQESLELREKFFKVNSDLITDISKDLAICLAKGNKILLCGNGGSAADAQHIAAELVNRFVLERPPLAAIALTTDTSILTAIGNDFGFEEIFSKQVQALGNSGDILLGISTSGNSKNIIKAFEVAREKGITTLGLTGKDGGLIANLSDRFITVPHNTTALIQEIHITVGHLLCTLIDYFLFQNALILTPYLENKK